MTDLIERLRNNLKNESRLSMGYEAADALEAKDQEIERLNNEWRVQNKYIADQHDVIRELQIKVAKLESDLLKCRAVRLAETIRDLPEIKAAFERIAELEAALREAMQWNWMDDDLPERVEAMCKQALGEEE